MTFIDWRGQEISVGDTIVYPGRASSSLWMNEATVLEINVVEDERWNWQTKEKYIVLRTELKVQCTNGSGYHKGNEKPSTITAVERVTKVA